MPATTQTQLEQARARVLDLERQLSDAEHVRVSLKRQVGLKDERLGELNFRLSQVQAACTRANTLVGDIITGIGKTARREDESGEPTG